jgi:hypothetical protein
LGSKLTEKEVYMFARKVASASVRQGLQGLIVHGGGCGWECVGGVNDRRIERTGRERMRRSSILRK